MDLQDIVDQLHAERNRLDQAIAALEGTTPRRGRPPKAVTGGNRRVMSAAARKRISAAMKARWWVPNETGKSCSKEDCSSAPDEPCMGWKKFAGSLKLLIIDNCIVDYLQPQV